MRYLMMLVLLPVGAIIGQPAVMSTWRECAEWMCHADAAPSSHRQAETTAGRDHALALQNDAPSRLAVGPDLTPDPVQSSVDVPLSFNDPVYANVTGGASRITLSPGSSRTDLSIVENSGDPTITCSGSCSLTRVRIQSREGVRCVAGNIDLTWVYVTATGVGSDHADGLQCYAPGSAGVVTVKNSTFKMAGATNAGYFSADNWRGSHVLENVLFEGGNYGLRIPADGGSTVSLKNVYFVRGSFRYAAFLFDVINGQRINIERWENVRWASWRGDQLVLGDLIRRP
ncbi:hypothetical protein I6F35_10770 [Bradyrhizobium sp. BRP22]|uniref:hypothetical protein n=1 Tax=Bradyrhizobium sp. BRP22 TaxID=2793821 RepID=UPI001CD582DB|nr:hypothetical protein [Bradyrhizobium sp. BRP22]MCA1453693.1 hypothetical protein [Bradyrhizobium sp. BRP22]